MIIKNSKVSLKLFYLFIFIILSFFMFFIPYSKNTFSNYKMNNILDNNPKVSFITIEDYINNYFYNERKNVIDLRDFNSYIKNHLIQALYFNIDNIFFNYNGIPNKLRNIESLIYDLEDMGLNKYNDFFIYSYSNDYLNKDFNVFILASLLYMLRVNSIYIIENPFNNISNDYLSSKVNYIKNKGYFSISLTKNYLRNYFIDYKQLDNKINNGYKLVFVYKDLLFNKDQLIPNSISLKINFNKDRYVLGSYLNGYNINKTDKIILYSYDLKNSLFMFFVIKVYMGYYDVLIYDGGLLEWKALIK
ncbi:MAG: rhodanese-like domain-containing protein [bacterium]|nr:rhodanese-like domain-containing protein [bacterium]